MNARLVVGLRTAAVLAVAIMAGSPVAVRAQVESREGIALQNQLMELHNELDALRSQITANGGSTLGTPYQSPPPAGAVAPGDLTAQLLTRLGALEEHVRTLTGRVDELGNQVRRQGELFNKQIGDLNFRLQGPEGGGARPAPVGPRAERVPPAPPSGPPVIAQSEPPAMSPPPGSLGSLPLLPPPDEVAQPAPRPYPPEASATPLPLLPPPEPAQKYSQFPREAAAGTTLPLLPPPTPEASPRPNGPRTPDVALREGEAALARRDYAAAEAAARDAMGNGRSSRAADAQFLMAQIYAAQRNYPQAAVAYDDAYRRSPNGPHAQEALLGMANSLAVLGSKPAACAALDKLQTEFQTQRGAIREAALTLRQREACRP